eukprot:1418651-Rhodomonas_salina.1
MLLLPCAPNLPIRYASALGIPFPQLNSTLSPTFHLGSRPHYPLSLDRVAHPLDGGVLAAAETALRKGPAVASLLVGKRSHCREHQLGRHRVGGRSDGERAVGSLWRDERCLGAAKMYVRAHSLNTAQCSGGVVKAGPGQG